MPESKQKKLAATKKIIDKMIPILCEVYSGKSNNISNGATLYYSPKAQKALHKSNPTMYKKTPPWDFTQLEEINIDNIKTSDDFNFYKYKGANSDLYEDKNFTTWCIEKEQLKKEEAVVLITIERYKEWDKDSTASSENVKQGGTLSRYKVHINGVMSTEGYMLEAAGPDSKVAGSDRRISAGSYNLIKNPGSKGHFRLVQLNQTSASDMFGTRALVNIHIANYPSDIEGCFAPGSERSENGTYPSVSNSSTAYNELKSLIIDNSNTESTKTFDGGNTYNSSLLYTEVKLVVTNNME